VAHKKSGRSGKNGRNSPGQRLGVKHFASEFVKSGSVLIRQRGTKIEPGTNVGRGKDDTLFALKDGVIRFERINRNKRRIAVIPAVGA